MHLKVFWGVFLHQKVHLIFKYPFFHLITFLSEDFLDITTLILFYKV